MAIGNGAIYYILPPLVYQLVMIIFMGLLLCWVNGEWDKKYFVYAIYGLCFFLVIEMFFSFMYEYIFNIMWQNTTFWCRLLLTIPTKIIEIMIVRKERSIKIMSKSWLGTIKK